MSDGVLNEEQKLRCAETFRDALRHLFANDNAWPIDVDSVDELFDCLLVAGLKPTPEDEAAFKRVAMSAAETSLDNCDDADILDGEAEALTKIFKRLGIDDETLAAKLLREANKLRESADTGEQGSYDDYRESSSVRGDDNVDDLFKTLLDR
jgi:hypothetical protein